MKLSDLEIQELQGAVSEVIYNVRARRKTAYDLLQTQQFLSLGDAALDALLAGGITTRGITEIVGER